MATISRQLLICLVFGFFICGIHCPPPKYPQKKCSRHLDCPHDLGRCDDGLCRCIGMYTGNGIFCRKGLPCRPHVSCPKYGLCMIDPLFPEHEEFCMCDLGKKPYWQLVKCADCLKDSDCKQNGTICTKGDCTCADKAMYRDPPCTCKDGLVMGKGKCEPGPLHECQADSDCDSRAKCIKGKCFCGGNSTGNGRYCRDSTPCQAGHHCDVHSKCVVDSLIPDIPHCVCSDGYRKTDDGMCVEITECFRKQGRDCPIDQICDKVSNGSYECTCIKGYEFITSESVSTCQDTDECKDPKTCPANFACINHEGTYACECKAGYKKNDTGDCQAECKCKKHEVCSEGKCICKNGYKKNKKGHCVKQIGKPLLAGTAQVSGYLNTFIIGILGSLAFST